MINCKVELKLKWTKYCAFSANANDNNGANSNTITFTIKDTKLHVSVVTLSAKENQKLMKLLSKEFQKSVYWNEFKTHSDIYIYIYIFLESNFVEVKMLFVLVYSNQDANARRFRTWKYCLPKGSIKSYNVIIDGTKFYDQPSDSNITQYEEIS